MSDAANDHYRDRDPVLWFLWSLFALAWFGVPALVIYLIERPLS